MARNVEIKARTPRIGAIVAALQTMPHVKGPLADGIDEAHRLMTALGVAGDQLIEDAYVELPARARPSTRGGPRHA